MKPKKLTVDLAKLGDIVEVSKERLLNDDERNVLAACQEVLTNLFVREPRNSEKTKDILNELEAAAEAVESEPGGSDESAEKSPRKGGNGRTPREGYAAANDVDLPHPTLKPGDPCPCGCGYKLYEMNRPAVFRYFVGQVPIDVTFYYRQQLKSAGCDNTFTAPLPEGVGPKPYDATAISMFILMRYGLGLPMYRQAMMLGYLGIPIAASTQYEVVADAVEDFKPVHQELVNQAAQGQASYVDDTNMKILKYQRDPDHSKRTGLFTTGIISVNEAIKIALFFTGSNHAGENMKQVLQHREADLPAMLQMSDALSRNFSELEPGWVVECCCMCHGRRNFVEIVRSFPDECRHVLEAIGQV